MPNSSTIAKKKKRSGVGDREGESGSTMYYSNDSSSSVYSSNDSNSNGNR